MPVEGRAGCVLPVCILTAVPALRCPLRAFSEPSWTSFHTRVTKHRSPGVTVSILGIRRAKLDVLHATDHPSQQSRRYGVHRPCAKPPPPALWIPPRQVDARAVQMPAVVRRPWAFSEPSWTCYTPLTTHHSSPGVTVSILGIRRAKLDVLHAIDSPGVTVPMSILGVTVPSWTATRH